MKLSIKKGDKVKVLAGKDKGQTGEVLGVNPETGRVIVQGINMIKRHQSQKRGFAESGIVEREASIHVSNVNVIDPELDKPTRIRIGENKEGKKVRIAARSGAMID